MKPISNKNWVDEAYSFQENNFAIIRQFGNRGFEWIADDFKTSIPMGYLNSYNDDLKDFPLWKGNVFITSDLERLYKMWRKCQNEGTHHYRIVKLNLSVEPVNHELIVGQMMVAAKDKVLAKLSEEDRDIIMNAG